MRETDNANGDLTNDATSDGAGELVNGNGSDNGADERCSTWGRARRRRAETPAAIPNDEPASVDGSRPYERAGYKRVRLHTMIDQELLEAIDRVRGDQTRAAWFRAVVYRHLRAHGLKDLPEHRDLRGDPDVLLHTRQVSDRWKRQERRKRRQRAYSVAWRRGERGKLGRAKVERDIAARRALQEADSVEWTWGPTGAVQASDLAGLGISAAEIGESGEFHKTSRHSEGRVLNALRAAIAADPHLDLAPRYRLFLAKHDPSSSG